MNGIKKCINLWPYFIIVIQLRKLIAQCNTNNATKKDPSYFPFPFKQFCSEFEVSIKFVR